MRRIQAGRQGPAVGLRRGRSTYGQVLEVQTDKDLYELLGLPEIALQDDIHKAHYRVGL